MLGKMVDWLRLPGFVRPMIYEADDLYVEIKTSPQYTVLTINGTELYLRRATGKLDGTGVMVPDLPRVALTLLDSPEDRTRQ